MYLSSFDHLINAAHSKKGMADYGGRHKKADGGVVDNPEPQSGMAPSATTPATATPATTAPFALPKDVWTAGYVPPPPPNDTSYKPMHMPWDTHAKGGQVRRRRHKEYGGPVGSGDGGPVTQQMLNQQISQGEGYHSFGKNVGTPIGTLTKFTRRGGEIRGRHHKK